MITIPLLGTYLEKAEIWKDIRTPHIDSSTVYSSQDTEEM